MALALIKCKLKMRQDIILFGLIFLAINSFCQTESIKRSKTAISLNGKTQYLCIPDNQGNESILNTENELTIEALIKPLKICGYNAIANKHWCHPSEGGAFHFGVRDGKLTFVWTETGDCNSYASVTTKKSLIKNNKQVSVGVTFFKGQVTLFVNGKPQDVIKQGDLKRINVTPSPILIGSYKKLSGEYSSFFYGIIDEFRFWNVARTPQEIKANRKKTFIGKNEHLVVNLSFENIPAMNEYGSYSIEPICIAASLPEIIITRK